MACRGVLVPLLSLYTTIGIFSSLPAPEDAALDLRVTVSGCAAVIRSAWRSCSVS
jgi:hypothetical protein